jgi:hypothetical protein
VLNLPLRASAVSLAILIGYLKLSLDENNEMLNGRRLRGPRNALNEWKEKEQKEARDAIYRLTVF